MLGQHPLGPTFPDVLWGLGACYSLSIKAQAAHPFAGGATECW